MNQHADYRDSSSEEGLPLFDEKTLSDLELDDVEDETERHFSSPQWVDTIKPWIRTMRICSWRTTAGRTAWWLLPSFVQSAISREESKPEKLYPTAYLDGMRGLAALFVFFCHYAYGFFVITAGYGYEHDDIKNNSLFQLPIIRLLYSGPPMVCIFFVVSGYALSLKPLKLMRSRSWDALSTTMTSSIFRRGLRLFLPTTISTFMVLIMLRMGLYETNREFAQDNHFFRNIREYHAEMTDTMSEQLYHWMWKVFEFIHIWDWEQFGGSTSYDVHLWTIPVEFRASMLLFLVLIGTARLKMWIRWAVLAGVTWFSYRNGRWEMILFFAGMFLAELDLVRLARRNRNGSPSSSPLPSVEKAATQNRNPTVKRWFWIVFGVFALYLMSQPDADSEKTPGWIWLCSWIPEWFAEKYRFWQCIGSILFVLATNFSPTLQRPFNAAFVRYFGKISYAIYLMHGPVLHTIGYTILRWSWGVTGHETESQYVSGFALSAVFVVPIVVWASDLFWRAIDAPTVRFARWVEEKCDAGDK